MTDNSKLFDAIMRARRTGELYPDPDDESAGTRPLLWEFLTRTIVDDEYSKDPAKISISLGSGGFTVELIDPSLGVMINCTSRTLDDAFDAMERTLKQPDAPVRLFKDQDIKLKKRKTSNQKKE